MSRKTVEAYLHLKTIGDKLYLSGGTVDLLIGTDFVDAFVDIHTNSGNPGEPVAKRNCFGWYILGQLDSDAEAIPRVHSVDIGGRHEALGTSSLIGQLFYFRCSGCINFIGSRLIGLI